MKGIVRKTWKPVEVDGVPTDVVGEFQLIDRKDGKVYREDDVLVTEGEHKKYKSLYIAKDGDGKVHLFSDKPKKSVFRSKWKGTCIAEFCDGVFGESVLSCDNAQPLCCDIDIHVKTDLYRPHTKKK